MAFKINVSDPKTGKSFQKEVEAPALVGKRVGEKIQGSLVELAGYELEITGGSDKVGNPMRKDVRGPAPRRLLLGKSVGYNPKDSGMRKKKRIHGRTISSDIVQLNLKVVKAGSKKLEDIMGKPAEEAPAEGKTPKEEKKEEEPKAEDKKEDSKEEKKEEA